MVKCFENLYEILNVDYSATSDEIKVAYKKLVRIYHPDINKTKTAEIKFKLLNNAYQILSDKEKRANYDNLLKISGAKFDERKTPPKARHELSKTFHFEKKPNEEILKDVPQTPVWDENSILKEIKITMGEAKKGTKRMVNILNKQTCPKCHGKKFINGVLCAFCRGEGQKLEYKKIEVEIQRETKDGDFICVGKINNSAVLDKNLFLKIKIEPYKKIFFEENNILVYIDLFYEDLILGCKKEIAIQGVGIVNVNIPAMTAPETRIKLDVDNKNANFYAVVKLNFPSYISSDEKILYDRIRKNLNGEINAGRY